MPKVKIRTTQNIDLEYETANVGLRIAAYFLDLLIPMSVMGLYFFISYQLFPNGGLGNFWIGIALFLFAITYVFYDLLCEAIMNGQSFGKKLLKIKVVKLDGTQPRLGDYVIRWLLRLIDMTLTSNALAIILVAFGGKGQRLGDIAAGTTVISLREQPAFQETIFEEVNPEYEVVYPEVSRLTDKDVQLIKNILTQSRTSENHTIVFQLAKKMESVLEVTAKQPPKLFVDTILKDYNHLNSGFEDGELF